MKNPMDESLESILYCIINSGETPDTEKHLIKQSSDFMLGYEMKGYDFQALVKGEIVKEVYTHGKEYGQWAEDDLAQLVEAFYSHFVKTVPL